MVRSLCRNVTVHKGKLSALGGVGQVMAGDMRDCAHGAATFIIIFMEATGRAAAGPPHQWRISPAMALMAVMYIYAMPAC